MNQFPVERHRRQMVSELLVHYNAEVTPDEGLALEVSQEEDVSILRGLCGDSCCFSVQGRWRSRL